MSRRAYDDQYSAKEWSAKPTADKQEILENALSVIAMHPVAGALLDMADADGVKIFFDPDMIGDERDGTFDLFDDTVAVCPLRDFDQMCNTLLHELRHYWQARQMNYRRDNVRADDADVTMTVLVNRVMEADAFAFAELMMKDLTGIWRAADAGKNPPEKLLMDDPENMAEAFIEKLAELEGYDERAIALYRESYLPRFGAPEPKELPAGEEFIDIPRLRRLLKSGVTPDAPVYMAGLADDGFVDLLKKSLPVHVARPMRLIDAFEKSAAKMNAKESRHARMKIAKAVKALDKFM